jgi:hypothetical protein
MIIGLKKHLLISILVFSWSDVMLKPPGRRSAAVRISLIVNDQEFDVAATGADSIRVRDAKETPPTTAMLVFRVDERETRETVYLPNGIAEGQKRVAFQYGT